MVLWCCGSAQRCCTHVIKYSFKITSTSWEVELVKLFALFVSIALMNNFQWLNHQYQQNSTPWALRDLLFPLPDLFLAPLTPNQLLFGGCVCLLAVGWQIPSGEPEFKRFGDWISECEEKIPSLPHGSVSPLQYSATGFYPSFPKMQVFPGQIYPLRLEQMLGALIDIGRFY